MRPCVPRTLPGVAAAPLLPVAARAADPPHGSAVLRRRLVRALPLRRREIRRDPPRSAEIRRDPPRFDSPRSAERTRSSSPTRTARSIARNGQLCPPDRRLSRHGRGGGGAADAREGAAALPARACPAPKDDGGGGALPGPGADEHAGAGRPCPHAVVRRAVASGGPRAVSWPAVTRPHARVCAASVRLATGCIIDLLNCKIYLLAI